MTKRVCDICGEELPNGRNVNVVDTSHNRYDEVCEDCTNAISCKIEGLKRSRVAAQKTSSISLVEFARSYREKCNQCCSCYTCRFHASRYGNAQMCVVRYAEALESGEMTLADDFWRRQ